MTKTLPGSAGPAHQPFRRPGVGRAFGGRPGSAVSFRESMAGLTSYKPGKWSPMSYSVREYRGRKGRAEGYRLA